METEVYEFVGNLRQALCLSIVIKQLCCKALQKN